MKLLVAACFAGTCLAASAWGQANPTEPVVTFGTTVVDNAGLRGTIYYLSKTTAILPNDFRFLKPQGTIYTRSLNVVPRRFWEGFPGVTRRLEWFAIDYTGRFWVNAETCFSSLLPRMTALCSL